MAVQSITEDDKVTQCTSTEQHTAEQRKAEQHKAEHALQHWFAACPGAVVAFSGGVDSALVAAAARRFLADRALAVIADSPSLARAELQSAERTAAEIGIVLRVVKTEEVADPAYQANDAQRCLHCKTHLYSGLSQLPEITQLGWWVMSGTNADDVGDWRPGLVAASNFQVRSPLQELGMGKHAVRSLARAWNLNAADKPASPCLASRLAYGLEVTPERLRMVEKAEGVLRELGLNEFRVRLHAGELARIEVPLEQLSRLVKPEVRQSIVSQMASIGFRYVTLDLEGFCSGSLNRLILPSSPRT